MLHYLQSITPKLALGGELIYQQGPGVPGGYISIFSLAGRFVHGDSTISGSLGENDHETFFLTFFFVIHINTLNHENYFVV